jgi:hypothetical protein
MAIHAPIHTSNLRWMISLLIKLSGEFQIKPWAEFDAVTTPFAAVFEDMYFST